MKKMLIISAVCILLGLAIAFGGMVMIGFEFTKLNTVQYETGTAIVNTDFQNISIGTREHDVTLAKSENDTCKVVYTTNAGIACNISVNNGTLTVTCTDTRAWYERIGIYWGNTNITVYLPQAQYDALCIQSVSGNIQVAPSFDFASAKLQSTSGSIGFCSDVNDALHVQTVSGNIAVYDSTGKTANIHATSGDVFCKNISAQKAEIITVSGDLTQENVGFDTLLTKTTSGELQIKNANIGTLTLLTTSGDILLSETGATVSTDIATSSGEVRFDRADLTAAKIKTISGDVEGTLRKAMQFYAETTSGSIRFPESDIAGGSFNVTTTSGDVHITIAD